MNLKKYYNLLLKKVREREDLSLDKHQLSYGKKSFAFYRIRSKNIGPHDRVLLIIAGLHGDETAGPATIQRYLGEIAEYAHRRDVKLVIYPLANPSGFQGGTRYNISGEKMNNDFVRYEAEGGIIKDEIAPGEEFKTWHWSSKKRLGLALPLETKLLHRLLRKDPLKNIAAFLDFHQDMITPGLGQAAYHYSFGDLENYRPIIARIRETVPVLSGIPISAGESSPAKTDQDGFIVRHDGTAVDLFWRLGVKYSVTAETTGDTPIVKARKANLIWIRGLIDLVRRERAQGASEIPAPAVILPKMIGPESRVNLVHTSSPVESSQQKQLRSAIAKVSARYPRLKIFDVEKTELDPRHLSASESERLTKFRRASKKVDWLQPVYGGTGAVDIIRHFDEKDRKRIKRNRPVINGFSDTTSLVNYFYFKLRLMTFHYSNFQGVASNHNNKDFFDMIEGRTASLEYHDKEYRWLGDKPEAAIEGTAIGGNLSTFRDFLEICRIRVRTWKPYIFFIEDVELDVEDLHRTIIALDNRGIFQKIRAIVLGRFDRVLVSRDYRKFNFMFGQKSKDDNPDNVLNYLLAGEIKERKEDGDPLYILKVNNLGHGVTRNNMIIPIGARTTLHKSGKIVFTGPFVS